jgi:hypothetical protein
VRDDHGGICNQHRVGVGRDNITPVSQHERPITLVDEFLLELSQRGLRAGVETFHDVAGFMLDQEAHCQGGQELPGSRFGGVE